MKKLITFYKEILDATGASVDKHGVVSKTIGDDAFPIEIKGRVLTVPVAEVLRNPNWDEQIGFHPLSENVVRGESEVLKKLRALILLRLTEVVNETATDLLTLAADVDRHKTLNPEQSQFLSLIPDADEKMVQNFVKLIGQSAKHTAYKLISIHLRRGEKLHGETYNRVCVVTSPFVNELDKTNGEVFGVKLRKKDIQAYRRLFDYILPKVSEHGLSAGSDSLICPYLASLLQAFANTANQLNALIELFTGILDEELITSTSWERHLSKLSEYRDLIPNLDGNDGVESKTAATVDAPVTAPRPVHAPVTAVQSIEPPAPVQPQTAVAPAPAKKEYPIPSGDSDDDDDGISFSDLMQKSGVPQVQTPPPMMQPMQPQGYPQQGYPQQGQPMIQPMQQPYQQAPMGYQQAPMGYPQQQPPMDPRMAGIQQQRMENAQQQASMQQAAYGQQPVGGQFVGYDQFNRPIYR